MQEGYYDYSEAPVGNGCCLNCYEAHPGCLCFDCKCKKCWWYSAPSCYDSKGHCDKVIILREKKKQEFKEMKEREYKILGKKLKILQEENKQIEIKLKKDGKIPNWYSCQVCQIEFVSEEELEIIPYSSPICDICNGKIKVVEDGTELY